MTSIYHIARRRDWENARRSGMYSPRSLGAEGFIHCSKRFQLAGVANDRFHGETGLVLLSIDTDRLQSPVRIEDCYDTGQGYPHIYGPVPTDAVTQAVDLSPNPDGTFSIPRNEPG